MEWVVGIQVDADARIFYVHMDDLKHCAPPDPEPSWPDVVRGTSIVVSTRAPSTLAPTDIVQCHQASGTAHQTEVKIFIWTQTQHLHLYGIYMMQSAYYQRNRSVALTLRDFAFSQWKDYSTHCNVSLWVIRNILDSLLNTREWTMSKDALIHNLN